MIEILWLSYVWSEISAIFLKFLFCLLEANLRGFYKIIYNYLFKCYFFVKI